MMPRISSSAAMNSNDPRLLQKELLQMRKEMFRHSNRAAAYKRALLAVRMMVSRLDAVGTTDILRRIQRGLDE